MEINRPLVLGITGASGSLYGIELARTVLASGIPLTVILTETARKVMNHETGRNWESWAYELDPSDKNLITLAQEDLSNALASGSFPTRGMVIAPCSMGTLGRISSGISGNLMERAADVTLKERRRLILLPRETPLNRIHLQNMLSLHDAGAVILPPVPAFYSRPESVKDIIMGTVHRTLDLLDLAQESTYRWKGYDD